MNFIDNLLHTRLAILTLSQAAGWITLISADESEMLAFVLPRTAPAAAVRLGCAIACHKHDEAVGAGNYHLFRLTTPVEEQLSRAIATAPLPLPHSGLDAAVTYLTNITEGMAIDEQPGPVRTGLYTDLTDNPMDTLICVAKHYLLAYQKGYQTYPYFL
ncbi:BrxE family protein [Dyadobacter chenhuakuii]|uniref:BrxE family protein n=1 Tax=Dyadobacter chenhuakuii TaxID=2909339 RepID=A0ABY4XMD5_9BACT|nr:BrxE family protein [Dyadobacter chenhuakuii]MCF2494281.1 BrxE family protein [Dyadobacter chenhuakuii]USJ31406.1 BrxE family protein [Dyadobacter chenhuakuii]